AACSKAETKRANSCAWMGLAGLGGRGLIPGRSPGPLRAAYLRQGTTLAQIIGVFETFQPIRHLLFATLILFPRIHEAAVGRAAGVEGTVQEVQMLTTTLHA